MTATRRIDAQRGSVAAAALAATTSGPAGVVAGEPFDVVLDLALAADAPSALIVTVEPAHPVRLAGAGRSRAILRPGEARRTWVTVVLPTDTEAGVHAVRIDVQVPGGVVLHRSCTVEVAGARAPAGPRPRRAGVDQARLVLGVVLMVVAVVGAILQR